MTNMTQHEKTLLLEDYVDDLAQYPAHMLNKACRQYRLNPENRFFPKVADLIALISPEHAPLNREMRIILDILEKIPETHRIEPPRPSHKDWDDLKAGLI